MQSGALIIASLAAFAAAMPAGAAEVSATASVQGTSDDNLYLLSAPLKQLLGKKAADHSLTAEGLLQLDFSSQTLQGQAHAAAERMIFARNKDFDNSGYDLGATVEKPGTLGSISFDGSSVRRLAPRQDINSTARSIQSLTAISGKATRSFLGDFRLIAGGDFARNTNSDPLVAVNDYQRYGARIGFGYYSPSGNIAAIEAHLLHSQGLNGQSFLINGTPTIYRSAYDERSIEGHLVYTPSVLLQFDARIGVAKHDDKSGFHNDLSGLIGQITTQWSPRQSLRFSLKANRDFQTSSGVQSNDVRETSLDFNGTAQATRSIALQAGYTRAWRDFLISVNQAGLGPGHKEQIATANAQLIFAPATRYSVTLNAQRSQRTSPIEVYRYKETVISATLAVRFGSSAFQYPSGTTNPVGS